MGKPILCLDFDGCINPYSLGWQEGVLYEKNVVPGFFEWANKARERFQLVVYSSRSKHPERLAEMKEWLEQLAYDWCRANHVEGFTLEYSADKPPAFMTIDDRAFRFDGDWAAGEIEPENLINFKPWNLK